MEEGSRDSKEFSDHYYTLGIDVNASGEVIEAAYWGMVREFRSAPNAQVAARKLDEMNDAYRTLTSPKLRRAYDEIRSAVLGPGASPQPPQEERAPPPLAIMEKMLPGLAERPDREAAAAVERAYAWPIPPRLIAALILLGLALSVALGIYWVLV